MKTYSGPPTADKSGVDNVSKAAVSYANSVSEYKKKSGGISRIQDKASGNDRCNKNWTRAGTTLTIMNAMVVATGTTVRFFGPAGLAASLVIAVASEAAKETDPTKITETEKIKHHKITYN